MDCVEFVYRTVEFARRLVHGVGLAEGGHVDDEFAGVADVDEVSLRVTPSERGCSVIDSTGGLRPTAVKNETGAMLSIPSVERVLTQAMGLGSTLPMSRCSLHEISLGTTSTMHAVTPHRGYRRETGIGRAVGPANRIWRPPPTASTSWSGSFRCLRLWPTAIRTCWPPTR